jgi:uncharacterized protein YjbJ (UPF0337 family)
MKNQQILAGDWNEIKGKLRSRWGQLSDDDLFQFHEFHGEVDKLAGTIERKTGEARDAIEKYLNDLSGLPAPRLGQTAENVLQYAQRTAESVQKNAKQAVDRIRARYIEAERFIHDRPGQALALSFAAGWLAGVLVRMMRSPS